MSHYLMKTSNEPEDKVFLTLEEMDDLDDNGHQEENNSKKGNYFWYLIKKIQSPLDSCHLPIIFFITIHNIMKHSTKVDDPLFGRG